MRRIFSALWMATAVAAAPFAANAQERAVRAAILEAPRIHNAALVDLVAADFFETQIAAEQATLLEAQTAAAYRSLADSRKAAFRAERRARWRALNECERARLRGVKRPAFLNLTTDQQAVFRALAADRLGAPMDQRPPSSI